MIEGQILMEAHGINGTLQLLPDRIRILRSSLLAPVYGRQSHLEIPLQSIKAVEYRKTAGGIAGYLTFRDIEGREEYEDYCVSFLKPQEGRFAALYKAIEDERAALAARSILPRVEILAPSSS
jgi:hypothetical protein